jgi:hypothetical protein
MARLQLSVIVVLPDQTSKDAQEANIETTKTQNSRQDSEAFNPWSGLSVPDAMKYCHS